jgi:lauroyl/myristoyl acyltransferase
VRDAHDNYLCRGYPPVRVSVGDDREESLRRSAQELLQVLEPALRSHPDQWHVMQPLFGPLMTEAADRTAALAGEEAPRR